MDTEYCSQVLRVQCKFSAISPQCHEDTQDVRSSAGDADLTEDATMWRWPSVESRAVAWALLRCSAAIPLAKARSRRQSLCPSPRTKTISALMRRPQWRCCAAGLRCKMDGKGLKHCRALAEPLCS